MRFFLEGSRPVLLGLAGLGAFAFFMGGPIGWQGVTGSAHAEMQATAPPTASAIRVKTIRPKVGPGLEVSVEQPAEIAPYYKAALLPQIAGTVKFLEKTIGDKVSAGEKLVELEPAQRSVADAEKAIIKAPFDGVIASRGVDPGAFVPSATIVPGAPTLLTIEKTDIVTVSMQVPDSFAAYVTKETMAELRVDAIPGRALRCKLSRTAPSLNPADRSLRIEVDLFNGTAEEFKAFTAKTMLNNQADLKSRKMPIFPEGLGSTDSARLIPGMFGRLKLLLKQFQNTPLIPSQAIVRLGGVPYIYLVEGGRAKRTKVNVVLDDGNLARVLVLQAEGVGRDLKTTEEIILSNQGELEDGSLVNAGPAE